MGAIRMQTQAVAAPLIIVACSHPGRVDTLTGISTALDRCEKALTQYLDLKKSAFPRFYFVSTAALLDMLAHSNTPAGVMPHLFACFDALVDLRLQSTEHAVFTELNDVLSATAMSTTQDEAKRRSTGALMRV